MKPSIVAKLEALHERHEEVQALLGDAQTIADQERFRALSREYAQLSDVSRCFTDWQQVQEDIETAQMMLDDPEMREMAQDEDCAKLKKKASNWSSITGSVATEILMTNVTPSSKSVPEPAATAKRRSSLAICSVCSRYVTERCSHERQRG
ncbi:Peptide chain release factor 1 [Escherichia coli]|nr:Peptide chain release factor 1 [Escherichia coli]